MGGGMIFFRGFFLVNFLPFGILVLAGAVLFCLRGKRREKWYYPLLFVILVLLAVSAWRIPFIIGRRYAMPVLVPGIVVSTYMVIILPEILRRYRMKYATATVRLLVVVLLAICAAKTLRFKERKPYLRELNKIIQNDCRKNKFAAPGLVVFGDPDSSLRFDGNVSVITVAPPAHGHKLFDEKFQFNLLQGSLDPEILKAQYSCLYLLLVEPVNGQFRKSWQKKFHDKPELLYEYVRKKNQYAFRLYRVICKVKVGKYKQALKSGRNLLKNGHFKTRYQIPPETPVTKTLRERGIDLFASGDVFLPREWSINPGDGWKYGKEPVVVKLGPGSGFKVKSGSYVSIYSGNVYDVNRTYLVSINAKTETRGKLSLYAYLYAAKGKFIHAELLKEIDLTGETEDYIIPFKFRNCENVRLALIFTGNVTVNSMKIVLVK